MNHFDATLIPAISEVILLVTVLSYLFWSRKKSSKYGPVEQFAGYRSLKLHMTNSSQASQAKPSVTTHPMSQSDNN